MNRRLQSALGFRWLAAALFVTSTVVMFSARIALAQRPILPICSDNPAYKLPPCTVPQGTDPQPPMPPSTSTPASTQFPFPGGGDTTAPAAPSSTAPAAPATPADKFPFPGSEPAAPTPATTPAPGSSRPSSGGAFPFPGEEVPLPVTDPNARVYDPKTDSDSPIRPAANPNSSTPPLPAAPAPGATPPPAPAGSAPSSSSSSSSDSSTPGLKDIGSEGSTPASRRRLPKVEDLNAREEEDVKVAKYYHSTGNYQAAYNRAKDALKIDPKDPDAQMALAMNAEKLKKVDEAVAGYTAYLKLEPDGDDAKRAQKALDALKPH